MKDLDVLDEVIAQREATLAKSISDLKPFFARANRADQPISAETAMQLSTDASRFGEETRNLSASFASVRQGHQQLEFLTNEITDIESLMEAIFIRADVPDPTSFDVSYKQFQDRVAKYRSWEQAKMELARLENEVSYELPEEDRNIEVLSVQRDETWSRMQELVQKHPEIAELEPPVGISPTVAQQNTSNELESLRSDREKGVVKVRSILNTHDETYLAAVQELDRVERDLHAVRHAGKAIELARDTLRRLSDETYVDWAGKLNALATEITERVGLELDNLQFDSTLKLTVSRRGQKDLLQSEQIMSQLSTGTKEQLHWLARMIVCKFLSGENQLPVILDEV
ncbi:MAG: hypothetical protein ACREMY_27730, partial [bacterium]